MQDRFRCRIWNNLQKEMYYGMGFIYVEPFIHIDCGYTIKMFTINEVKPMQCTGLKDKNGKLIYEGDIINGTCGVYWGKMIVKFNENEAKFYMYRVDKRYIDLHFHGKNQEDNFELEVIGNIYENPELLEDNK